MTKRLSDNDNAPVVSGRNNKAHAYYNEIDPQAAAWLRELIKQGHVAPGDVDERSIVDVRPADLAGYTQCHFFAGIGVWSYALRKAGWPDDRAVWTGSCPCQPFSSAGKGNGFDDERHLWPAWFWLIQQCRPSDIIGEQVASKDANPWVDLVQDDLEGMDYAFGAVPFPSAGVGAPHIRDRLYWTARLADDTTSGRREEREDGRGRAIGDSAQGIATGLDTSGADCRLAQSDKIQWGWRSKTAEGVNDNRTETEWNEGNSIASGSGAVHRHGRPSPTNGFWSNPDWLFCRDGKWRPVESGTFPLAHGASARVGRLRGYGNAINAEAAIAFIEAREEAVADITAANDNTTKKAA
ncbi:MAG: DNA cytosine methyltransferase [Ahrensia sp.]|nr:DNA cytosine methyltransferase [Ahrensia sp.]MBV48166.1 DNA cytosine methyltransferase [Roseobacter sp.]MBV48267.1 DNA cytosine methyltransferase [Roseobacter sp.]|tara:strand:- start:137572 stop:138630 length:1059 start_codon:yes stop_codon:yes gene_type:complete